MKNIRSSKGQDGFIGALLGLIVIGFVAYMAFVSLFFAVAVPMAINYDNEKEAEERAQYTDTEWIVKKEYDQAMYRCRDYPDRKYANFDCNWTSAQWAITPAAIKVITHKMGNIAEAAWAEENVTYYIIEGNNITQKRYPSMSKVPCTYTYLNKTYNCQEWR
jgi:hypothetical protein